MNKEIIPDKYTPEEWDEMLHNDRILALKEYSKKINSRMSLYKIKHEIEYYQNIKKQIDKLVEDK